MTRHTAEPPQKSTLFCPACAYSDAVDGHWRYRRRDGSATVECPRCDTAVAVRERTDHDFGHAVRTTVRAWNRVFLTPWRAWCDAVESPRNTSHSE